MDGGGLRHPTAPDSIGRASEFVSRKRALLLSLSRSPPTAAASKPTAAALSLQRKKSTPPQPHSLPCDVVPRGNRATRSFSFQHAPKQGGGAGWGSSGLVGSIRQIHGRATSSICGGYDCCCILFHDDDERSAAARPRQHHGAADGTLAAVPMPAAAGVGHGRRVGQAQGARGQGSSAGGLWQGERERLRQSSVSVPTPPCRCYLYTSIQSNRN